MGRVATGRPGHGAQAGQRGITRSGPGVQPGHVAAGIRDFQVGDDILVLTWLDQARRDVLSVHPRDDPSNPERGVFSTRSADRPNPIGLHRVQIVSIGGTRIVVRDLEAVNATPILDVKPTLNGGR